VVNTIVRRRCGLLSHYFDHLFNENDTDKVLAILRCQNRLPNLTRRDSSLSAIVAYQSDKVGSLLHQKLR